MHEDISHKGGGYDRAHVCIGLLLCINVVRVIYWMGASSQYLVALPHWPVKKGEGGVGREGERERCV